MASIDRYPSPKGVRWRARWRTPDGASRSKMFPRKLDAERFLVQLEQAKLRGAYVDPAAGRILFKEYGEKWRFNQVHHRPGTKEKVESDLKKHLYPVLGGSPMNLISRSDVQAWVTTITALLAPATVNVVYSYLATIFKSAVADGIVATSPCHGIVLPAIPTKRVAPLTREQIEAIAESMPPRHRAWVLFAAMTGLRFGELAGLTLDRVNFFRKSLTVDRQWGGRGFGPPKTPTSVRNIPLGELAIRVLADHLAGFPALEPEGLVFHAGGRPMSRTRANEIWKRALERAAMGRDATPHDLRHFYASALIRQGADVKLVQNRLGHKSAKTTIDTYGHLWPDSDDRTRTAIDSIFHAPAMPGLDIDGATG